MFNDLFWALYWIDVLSGLGKDIIFGGLFVALMAACTIAFICLATDPGYQNEEEKKRRLAVRAKLIPRAIWSWIGAYLLMVVLCFIPSKQTMYLMLGVKGGEAVVNSEFGKKIGSIIEGQLDEYVEAFGKKKKKE